MVSLYAFLSLVGLVAIQRVGELFRSKRHEADLLARGAVECVPAQMPWMASLHALWLVSAVVEVLVLGTEPTMPIAAIAIGAFVLGQILRLAAMHALRERWTVKVLVLPGEPAVQRGIFRFLRHPNYLGVVLEIAALPLVHGAWITAVVFSIANGALLFLRIRGEERGLREIGADYDVGPVRS